MSRAIADAVICNLKRFNAKERDHLMRFAYLGQNAGYSMASKYLSDEFDKELRKHVGELGLASDAKCVFAGMDYHLDWLFAALWLARTAPTWAPGQDELRVPMAKHEGVAGLKSLYTDFRPLNGSQEDIDLLAVYDDGEKLAVLLIEAKGRAAFNKVQLARKIIRLDRILIESGMFAEQDGPKFRLILAAPEAPKFDNCLDFAKTLNGAKFQALRSALDAHPTGIGNCFHFIHLSGFPEETYAVERLPDAGVFTHWTLSRRC